MVLEEQPGKVAEAVKLFLQGLGYIMRPRKAASTQVKYKVGLIESAFETIRFSHVCYTYVPCPNHFTHVLQGVSWLVTILKHPLSLA